MENPPALTAQLFSSLKRRGIEEAQRVVAGWLALPEAQPAVANRCARHAAGLRPRIDFEPAKKAPLRTTGTNFPPVQGGYPLREE
jgi:hypothetical protein